MSLSAAEALAPPGPEKIARHGRAIEAAVETALMSGSGYKIADLPPDLADEARRRLDARLAERGETTRSFTTPAGVTVSWG